MIKGNWVEFNESALHLLRALGMKHFAVITDTENEYALQIYPFVAEAEVHLFMAEYGHLGSRYNYTLEDDEVLQELSEGVDLIQAKVLMPK